MALSKFSFYTCLFSVAHDHCWISANNKLHDQFCLLIQNSFPFGKIFLGHSGILTVHNDNSLSHVQVHYQRN